MKCDRYIGTGYVNANKNGEAKCPSSVSRPVASLSNGRSTYLDSRLAIDTNASNLNDTQQNNANVPTFTNGHIAVSGSTLRTQPRMTSKDEVLGNSSSSQERRSEENTTRCIVIEMKQSATNKSKKAKCDILSKQRNDKTSIKEYKVTLLFYND